MMRLRTTSLAVATLCSVAWLSPAHAWAGGPPLAPPKPTTPSSGQTVAPAQAPASASTSAAPLPASPCSAWASDPGVLKPAPSVCRNYISSKGNSMLKLEEPMLSKVPQDPEVVTEFAGIRGTTATAEFQVDQPWRVDFESDSDFLVGEVRYGPMNKESVIAIPKISSPGSTFKEVQAPGTYYLNIRADGGWRAKISLLEKTYRYDYDIAATSELFNPAPLPVLITYSFGEGKRQEITLNPGQKLPISGNIALSDYTEPRRPEQLREDFPGLLIHRVENVSQAAVNRRQEMIRKKREAKLDPRRTRSQARSELQHTAIDVQDRNQKQQHEDELTIAQIREDKDRSWKRRWGTAGVATMIAGVGTGTALLIVGGTRLPEAKDALALAKAERAQMGDNPSPNIEVEVGRRSKEVANARNLVTVGAVVAGAGLVLGTAMLVVANQVPSKRRSHGYALKVRPQLGFEYYGAGASLRF